MSARRRVLIAAAVVGTLTLAALAARHAITRTLEDWS